MLSEPVATHPNLSPASKDAILEHLSPYAELPARQEELARAFKHVRIDEAELRRCGGFVAGERSRHVIAKAEAWVLLAIFWDNMRSPIHDHEQSDCGFRVIAGEVEETRYKLIKDDLVTPVATRMMSPGDTAKSKADAIHCLGAPAATGGQSITLHLYSPILGYDAMGIYRQAPETVVRAMKAAEAASGAHAVR